MLLAAISALTRSLPARHSGSMKDAFESSIVVDSGHYSSCRRSRFIGVHSYSYLIVSLQIETNVVHTALHHSQHSLHRTRDQVIMACLTSTFIRYTLLSCAMHLLFHVLCHVTYSVSSCCWDAD